MGQLPPLPYQGSWPPQAEFPLPQPPIPYEPSPLPAPPLTPRVLIAWCLIAIAAAIVIWHWSTFRQDAQSGAHHTDIQLDIASRFAVGYKLLFRDAGAMQPANADGVLAQMRDRAKTPLDELRIVPVIAELQGHPAGAREAARFLYNRPVDDLTADGKALEQAYLDNGQSLGAAERQRLEDRYGWYGQLAVSQFPQPGDTVRADVEAAAKRTVFALFGMLFLVAVFLIGGLALCIVVLAMRANGAMLPRYPRGDPSVGDALVEGFAVYLLLMASMTMLNRVVPAHPGPAWNLLALVPVLAAVAWVRMRGITGKQLAEAVGWNVGGGFFREVFAGIVGYIAGIPLIAIGMCISQFLARFSETKATHPLDFEIEAGGWVRIVLIFLACIFAPITEELIFRGMLLRHMSTRCPAWLSAIGVSVIFAAIHPQGWTTIPALGSIGLVLALIRLQRDSLVASMTAHAMNNSLLVVFLILATG